jgi:outer membrane protein assembly factor BamB
VLRLKSSAVVCLFLAARFGSAQTDSFDKTLRPFFARNCLACHSAKTQSGGLNVEALNAASVAGQHALWEKIAYVLETGQMPPEGAPRPSQAEITAVSGEINRELARSAGLRTEKPAPATPDWITWNGGPERTGWARAENRLSAANAPRLQLLWKTQLDAKPTPANLHSTITDPLVVTGIMTSSGVKDLLVVASADDSVYAINAASGALAWRRDFANHLKPVLAATGSCPNNLNATPVIDKTAGLLYVLTNDGKLRTLGLGDGDDRVAPSQFTEPYSRNWSLNLVDGYIYTSSTRGCGEAISSIEAIKVSGPARPVMRFYPSTGKASGPWGRGGIVAGPSGVFAQTADGAYDPAAGRFGESILELTNDLRLTDSFTPANWEYLNRKDLDLGSASPVVFPFGKWTLAAAAAKEGVIYLLDTADLGGADHHTPLYVSPRYGNEMATFHYSGVWGAMSTWLDPKGDRWLLVPMEGPVARDAAGKFRQSNGAVVNGSVMAFKLVLRGDRPALEPQWISGDLDVPGIPVFANGVVYVLATGDRAGETQRPGNVPRKPGKPPMSAIPRGIPGADRDSAWIASQYGPDGQQVGDRFSGGRDSTHAVLYALDAETGKELYSSADTIDSWTHYGALAISNGRIFISTYHGRVFAFGLPSR